MRQATHATRELGPAARHISASDGRQCDGSPRSGRVDPVPALTVHHTTSGRAGRRFQATDERQLHDQAVAAAASLPGAAAGVLAIPEMTGPIGIPDFVAVVGGRDRIARRVASGIPPITGELDCAIVSCLFPRRPRTASSIAAELQLADAYVEGKLAALGRIGAVHTARGSYTRAEALTPGGTLYAIEAKLTDWRRAVRQARGYRTWANNYVLVMGTVAERSRGHILDELRSDHAGLYFNNAWTVRPRPVALPSRRRHLAFEYLAAALMDSSPRLP